MFYKDISRDFLTKDGGLSADIMPDYLHLSGKGYDIWGRAIKADIEKLAQVRHEHGRLFPQLLAA